MGFFPPTERENIVEPFSGPEAVSDALQWSPSLVTLTVEIQPTAFHTLRGTRHKPIHMHMFAHISPKTDAQTLFKYIHRKTTEICIQ